MTAPRTQYARAGDVHIAYQVVGDGPVDVVWLDNWLMPLEGRWLHAQIAEPLRRLTQICRLISFDKRGVGMSDPVPIDVVAMPESWVEDVITVMDAAGSEGAAIVGINDGGMTAMLFAATHPDRTSALVLMNTTARMTRADDYPEGLDPDEVAQRNARQIERWTDDRARPLPSSGTDVDESVARSLGTFRRLQASPATARRLFEAHARTDVRHVLPSITAPSLVCFRPDNAFMPSESRQYIADRIPDAKVSRLPGAATFWWASEADAFIDDVIEFLTGVRPTIDSDRVFATVLFTDIVSSTPKAAALGDRKWKQLLDAHDRVVRTELERFRGNLVKSTGDGVLATFDGPARGVRCAAAIRNGVRSLDLDVRFGLHAGEVEMRVDDVTGIAVNIGQRVSALAGPGEILVSRTVTDLVAGSGLGFEDRGEHDLKGVPGSWQIFAVKT